MECAFRSAKFFKGDSGPARPEASYVCPRFRFVLGILTHHPKRTRMKYQMEKIMSGSSLAKKSAPHGERAVTKPVKLPGFLETYRASPFERVAAIRKGVPAAAVAETSKAMGMPQERLYQILRLPRTTVTRKIAENGVLSREGSERVIGLRKIIGQVEQMVGESGDPEGFNAAEWVSRWLESPSSALGGQKPGELMDTTEGQELVSRLIARMQSGAYA